MDRGKFWYYVGSVVGIFLKVAIYAAGIYGLVTQIWNHEIPYLPIILMLTFHMWTRILVMYEAVGYLINSQKVVPKTDTAEIERIVNLVNFRNMYRGGPN